MATVSATRKLRAERVEVQNASSGLERLLLPLALVLTFVAYSGTLRYEFVYDDGDFLVRNRSLESWAYLPRYFSEHLWSYRDMNLPGNYYRPLFLVWALINRSVLGLNSAAWHISTVLTYLASIVVVYFLTRRLFGDKLIAGLSALIFGLHPLHIETAAWNCGVSEPVLALLFVPAFLFYLKGREAVRQASKQRLAALKWTSLSLVFYTAALFAKETAIILPMIIIAYELIVGDAGLAGGTGQSGSAAGSRGFLRASIFSVRRIIPFAVITAVYLVIRAMVLGGVIYTPVRLPLQTKLLTVPSLVWAYLKLMLFPVGLSEFYDTPYVERPGLIRFVLPLAGVLVAIALLWFAIRRLKSRAERHLLAFACAWIIIPLLPVLNIGTFRKGDLIHDRYLFLPSIGLAMLAAYGVRKLKVGSGRLAGLPAIQALAILVLAGALGLGTAYQHVHWANDLVLFHHSLAVAPGNEIAQNAFGDALSKRELYDEAIVVFEDLIRIAPENATAHYNLGYNYYKVGRYQDALPHLAFAVSANSKDEREYLTLGVTLFFLDRYGAAEQVLRQGLSLRKDGLGLHYALGAVYKTTGRLQEALGEFNQELVYNPDYASAYEQIEQINKQLQGGGSSSH